MVASLALPVLMLLAVPLVAVLVLKVDGNGRKLEARVAALAVGTPAVVTEAPTRRLRLVEARHGSFTGLLRRLVSMPENVPEARKYPVPVVILVSAAFGLLATLFARLYLPMYFDVPFGVIVGMLFMRSIFASEMRAYAKKLRRQMPDMIELVVSATIAGLPVTEGFSSVAREMASPTKGEFERICRDIVLGVALDEALLRLFRRTNVAEYAIFAVTLGVQSRSGGKLSEVVMRLADTIRERLALAERAGALAGEAQFSAYALSVLPFIGGIAMAFIQPGYMAPLINDPRGHHLLFFGGVSLICGWFTMKHMITKATSE